MFRPLAFASLFFFIWSLTLVVAIGYLDLLLPKKFINSLIVPLIPTLLLSAIIGFRFGSKRSHNKSQHPRTVAKCLSDFRNEGTRVKLFYIILFLIPNGLLLLFALSPIQTYGYNFIYAFYFLTPMLNLAIMMISLLATPFIRGSSPREWAKYHVRNSIVVPILAVLIILFASALGNVLRSSL